MGKKRHRNLRDRGPAIVDMDSLLAMRDSGEFFSALEAMLISHGDADYERMPSLGKFLISLCELTRTVEVEGVSHYLTYSGDRWRDAVLFLQEIGSPEAAILLGRIFDMFSFSKTSVAHDTRIDEVSEIEDDPTRLVILDDLAKLLADACNNVPELIHEYLKLNRDQLRELMLDRKAANSYVSGKLSLSDDEIISLAYSPSVNAFEGIECNLLGVERLQLLVKIAGDKNCPARALIIRSLYTISGSVGAQIIAGKEKGELEKVSEAIHAAGKSEDDEVMEWARHTEQFLCAPTPEQSLEWMGRIWATQPI